MRSLDEDIRLDKRRNHSIEAVIDRLLIKPGINERLGESIRTALKLTNGAVLVSVIDGEEKLYSEKMACVNCGINVPPLEPRSFSFNSAYGACRHVMDWATVLEIIRQADPQSGRERGRAALIGQADKAGSAYLPAPCFAVIATFQSRRSRARSKICQAKFA